MRARLPIAALLGAASVAGFSPLDLFPLPVLAVGVLCLLWQRSESAWQAGLTGLAWGLGFFLTGVSWVYVSLHDVGGMAAPVAMLATLLFCTYLALFPAVTGYAWWKISGQPAETRPVWRDALLLAVLWTCAEWLRGVLFTGFPWLALGYSQTPPSPLAGYASLLGIHGTTFAAALAAGFVAMLHRRRAAIAGLLVLIGTGGLLSLVQWTEPVGRPVTVSLLQGNVPQGIKWDPSRLPLSIDTYTHLASENPAELVVLPETAIPLYFDQIPDDLLKRMAGMGGLIVGTALRNDKNDSLNGAVAIPREGDRHAYAKRHLVPFGEFIPPGFTWFFNLVRIPMADFRAGDASQPALPIAGQSVAINICYEDLFGNAIIQPLPSASLLINLSNTAWFGRSLAQPQHLQIARMRAIETGRPMLRATNTGMTAIIAPDGQVTGQLAPFTGALCMVKSVGMPA
jgi:apolipoprotein N-acyltransferase